MNGCFAFGGATTEGGGTRFRAFVTTSADCMLRLFDPASRLPIRTLSMEPRGDGLFEHFLTGPGEGTLYKFVVNGRELPDPYARFLPYGVHGPAMVIGAPTVPISHRHRPRPLSEQILYELHVGTFTEEGTYRAACTRLPALVDLGVTTLELMPVSSFAGERGWGYDGVAHFAPFAPYGRPDELRALVAAAHELDLTVLLDVVYNHFGPAGNYLASFSPLYFDPASPTPWGAGLNFPHPAVRAYILDNARYWFEEFGFDGLRLDAVHAIHDRTEKHVVRELCDLARSFEPCKIMIAEDDRNDPAGVEQFGLDALWADDFHHQLRVTMTGERDGYYGAYTPGVGDIVRTVHGGWLYQGQRMPGDYGKPRGKPAAALPASAFVYCIQNHDQVGNRALGDRLNHAVSIEEYALASAVLLFLPMTPLLFMGQEWAATSPFLFFTDHDSELGARISTGRRDEFCHFRSFADPEALALIPDPQDPAPCARSLLRWPERDGGEHSETLDLYRALLRLRREDPVLRSSPRGNLSARAHGDVLVIARSSEDGQRILLANFGTRTVPFASMAGESWVADSAHPSRLLLDTLAFVASSDGAGGVNGQCAHVSPRQALILEMPGKVNALR